MPDNISLTEGKITEALMKLSLPIIATNFIQTAYGLVNMIWAGRLGSKAVAAIGTASFFVNLGLALFTVVMIGSGVKIAQSIGAQKEEDVKIYIKNSFILSVVLAALYSIFVILFKDNLIGFFELRDYEIEKAAIDYLVYSMIGVIFMYFNSMFSTILNSFGNSKLPFRVHFIGFMINIVLDPLLIFGFGSIEGAGVIGAATATNIARIIAFIIFLVATRKNIHFREHTAKFNIHKAAEVLKMGLPITLQRVTFIGISIVIAKIITSFGAAAIAVQKIGLQIESVSYMTIGGLQGAIAAYVGQNYGAKRYKRIGEGYFKFLVITSVFGIFVSVVFIIFPKQLIYLFIQEAEAVDIGINYMRILGFSQVFMCIELLTVGAFNGIGRTYVPPIVSITFTALRIPIAMVLSKESLWGLDGIWMSISISSLIKGVILMIWFIFVIRKLTKNKSNITYA